MKKLLSVITMMILLVVVLATTVNAAEIVDSGTCGENLTWTLDSAGVLTISGTGHMEHYYLIYEDCPWEARCDEITKVVVEEGVTTIGNYAFNFCAITEVSLPSTLTRIYEGAFYYCEELTHIDIPESVEGTADKWFAGCKSLKSVKMPAGVQYMPGTFTNCSALESVYIPANAEIGYGCFDGCDALTDVQFDPNADYCYDNGAIYNKDKTELQRVMSWCADVYTVPKTVQTIGMYAFSNADLLTEIRLPEGLQTIESSAFENCTGLETITIPNSVHTIGNHAFEGCTSLREIEIPYGIQTIEYNTFEGCTSLETIEIPDSVQTIGQAAFKNCSNLKNVVLPSGLEIVKDEMFYGCKELRQIVFPESVRYFGEYVFTEANNLEQVFFFGDVPAMEYSLFYINLDDPRPITVYHLEDAEGWQGDTWDGAPLKTWKYTLSGTASCTQPGSLIYTDAEHGLVYTKYTTQAMHLWSKPALGKYPTTQEDGYWIQTCTRCGKQEKSSVIPKFIETEQKPKQSGNYADQNYTAASRLIRSYLEPTEDGGYLCIRGCTAEYYDKDFRFLRSITVKQELPVYGGYYNDGTYRYLVVGQDNPSEDDTVEVVRVIRYTQDWLRIDSASLYGANTRTTFYDGLRMSHSGDMLYIRTNHTMYKTSDGKNHQTNMTLTVHTPSMKITSAEVTASMSNPLGYVSHSFNQFIQTDGQDVVAVDHGDAYPRAIVLQRNQGTAGKYYTSGECEAVNVLEIYGTIGANQTGASVGGLEISDTSYLVAGNSIVQDGSMGFFGQRNIFVTATSKEYFGQEGTTITWLTNYARGSDMAISTPHLVKVDEDTFAVLWTETEGTGFVQGVTELKLAYLDKNGQWDGNVYTVEGELSDCKPIVIDGRIVWYTSYSPWEGEEAEWAPEFYEIRPEDPTKIVASHRPLYWLGQAPTEETPGILTIYCINGCYHVTEMQIPALSEAEYTCEVTEAVDCTTPGKKVYTWKNTDYGVIRWEESVGGTGHTWQPATCDKPKTCTVCGLTEGYILGHSWQLADCDHPAICTSCNASTGEALGHAYDDGLDGTCNRCGIHRETTENRTVMHMFRMYDPNSGEHFYTGSVEERENLVAVGWNYEGVGFTFSRTTGMPVYRLYDPATGEHLYTMSEEEKAMLMAQGWNFEGIAFNSAYDTEVPQYRLHNPNASRGAYHFTASLEERDYLISLGWEYQGIGFYSSWK